MALSIIGILIGAAILCAGLYYLAREKADRESRKIYTVISIIGGLITAGMILRLVLLG